MKNTLKISIGYFACTALGVSIGLLLAPRKGTKTLEMITDKAKGIGYSTEKRIHRARKILGLNKKEVVVDKVENNN
jgi:hypothetical protein